MAISCLGVMTDDIVIVIVSYGYLKKEMGGRNGVINIISEMV